MKLRDLLSIIDENKEVILENEKCEPLERYNGKDSLSGNYDHYDVVKYVSRDNSDCVIITLKTPPMMEVHVTAYPFARQYGTVLVPEGVKDMKSYIDEHYDEIEFGDVDFDHDGADFDVNYAETNHGTIIYC